MLQFGGYYKHRHFTYMMFIKSCPATLQPAAPREELQCMDVYQIRIYKVDILFKTFCENILCVPGLTSLSFLYWSILCFSVKVLTWKWSGPSLSSSSCSSAAPQRAGETALQATLFCFASLILAQVLICSSWEELQIMAPISVVLETVKLVKPVWPKDSLHT